MKAICELDLITLPITVAVASNHESARTASPMESRPRMETLMLGPICT